MKILFPWVYIFLFCLPLGASNECPPETTNPSPLDPLVQIHSLQSQIKSETSLENPNQRHLECLFKNYTNSLEGTADWIAHQMQNSPSESTKQQLDTWASQIEASEENFQNFLKTPAPPPIPTKTCRFSNDQLMHLSSASTSPKEVVCCAAGDGPLLQLLQSQDDNHFLELTDLDQIEICKSKVRPSPQDFWSSGAAHQCMSQFWTELVNIGKAALSGLNQIFDLGTVQFLYRLITSNENVIKLLFSKIQNAVISFGEGLGKQAFVFSDCMNSIEKVQYTCRMIGPVVLTLFGPKMLGMLKDALASGIQSSKLYGLVSEAIRQNPKVIKAMLVGEQVHSRVQSAKSWVDQKLAPLTKSALFASTVATAETVNKFLHQELHFKDFLHDKLQQLLHPKVTKPVAATGGAVGLTSSAPPPTAPFDPDLFDLSSLAEPLTAEEKLLLNETRDLLLSRNLNKKKALQKLRGEIRKCGI